MTLTQKEKQVLTCLANGLDYKQIARKMDLKPSTIRGHIEKVRAKLGANTIGHAVALGFKEGIINIDNLQA